MNEKFNPAVVAVKAYLDSRQYSYSIIMGYLRCYRLLDAYLTDRKKPYSKRLASDWLEELAPGLCKSTVNTYRSALDKFDTAYHNKEIDAGRERYDARYDDWQLPDWCNTVLNAFIGNLPDSYDCGYVGIIQSATARFLKFLADRGICKPEDISHRLVADYYLYDIHNSSKSKDVYNNCVRKFLRYLSNQGMIKASIPLLLDKFVLARLAFIESLDDSERNAFRVHAGDVTLNAESYYELAVKADVVIKQHRYSKTIKNEYSKAWKELYVFLEANSLGYSIDTALLWAGYMRRYTVQWKSFRRAVMLFEQFRTSNQITPKKVYSYKTDRADALPEWCKADYEAFMQSKERAGFAKSTLAMYRSACFRLLDYLGAVGISSWEDVNPGILKEFHKQDAHATPEGKNAYSSKIRGFLEYLGDIGRLPPAIFLAVPSESAPRVNIVQTLCGSDIATIRSYNDNTDNPMALRNAAMILIGLRMGIRASDIVGLRFSDISWDKNTISIQQQKTGKFLRLPMPVEAGNAIYRYIVHGRPDTDSEFIFVSHRVPYDILERNACRKALLKALPDDPHGFHITRKTFASQMLENDVAMGRIAETLGHANNLSVMPYLSTHNDKMRLCAISLDSIPVKGGMLL